MALDCIAKFEEALPKPPVPPTPEETCYILACGLLQQTDWTQIPGSTLVNVAEFATYREAVRKYAITPIANPVWPVAPTAQWS